MRHRQRLPRAPLSDLTRDRANPSLFQAIACDPTVPLTPESVADQVRDMQRWTRYWILPVARVLVLLSIRVIFFVKRLLPFQLASEKALDVLGIGFVRYFVSPEAERFLLRHLCIETALINFIAENCGAPPGEVQTVDLKPTRVEHLGAWDGQNAVVRHDRNLFNLFIDLGRSTPDLTTVRKRSRLDFSSLALPPIEDSSRRRRLMNLDLHTTMYVVVFWLALLLDEKTTERAINSFQFDEGLMTCLANLTGDDLFRTWTPVRFTTWLGSPTGDPARDLHWHMLVNEYAHTHLCRLEER